MQLRGAPPTTVLSAADVARLAQPHTGLCHLSSAACCTEEDCLAHKIHCNHLFREVNLYQSWLLHRYLGFFREAGWPVQTGYALVYREGEDAAWEATGTGLPPPAGGADRPCAVQLEVVGSGAAAAAEYEAALCVAHGGDAVVLPLADGPAVAAVPWGRLLGPGWRVVVRAAPARWMSALLWVHVAAARPDVNVARTLAQAADADLDRGAYVFELQALDALLTAADPDGLWAELRRYEGERTAALGGLPPLRPLLV